MEINSIVFLFVFLILSLTKLISSFSEVMSMEPRGCQAKQNLIQHLHIFVFSLLIYCFVSTVDYDQCGYYTWAFCFVKTSKSLTTFKNIQSNYCSISMPTWCFDAISNIIVELYCYFPRPSDTLSLLLKFYW